MVAQSIAHYQVLEKVGEGGMGAVYKARDTHLNRLVALKLLPSDKVSDADRRKRFVQEARAASALNHPNIITVHDVSEDAGVHFIAMEYVDGRTLAETIGRDGLPLRRVLDHAIQIADALAAAHSAGIIHRDLKPANVMLTRQGAIKVLDFGVAKLTEEVIPSTQAATVSEPHSMPGTILGTTAYMSPEQVEARTVDARSDIFSFGALLYEMTTGQRAFLRGSTLATLSAILHEEPRSASEVVVGLPREMERVIARCLKKNPDERFQHIGDVKIALQDLKDDLSAGAPTSGLTTQRPALGRTSSVRKWIGAAVVVAVASAAGAAVWLRPRSVPAPAPQPMTAVPLTSYPGFELHPSLSPDGNQVAFVWNGDKQDNYDIYVKLVGPGAPLRLTTSPAADISPAWSPDGRWIAFLRLTSGSRGALILVPALGGPERQLADVYATQFMVHSIGKAIAWSKNSSSLIVGAGGSSTEPEGIYTVSIATSELRRLTTSPKTGWIDTGPALSPDDRTLIFTRFASFGIGDLYALKLGDNLAPIDEPKRLTYENRFINAPVWTPDGRDVVFSSGAITTGVENLFAIDSSAIADPNSQSAQMRPIAERAALPSIARVAGGRLRMVYARSHFDSGIWRIELPRRDGRSSPSEPKVVPFIVSTLPEYLPQYSPDGQRVAFVSHNSGAAEIWICDKEGANPVQLTSGGWPETMTPRWSPNGSQIVFQARPEGPGDIFTIPASGGAPKRVTDHPADDWGPEWSRDGRWIYFTSSRSGRYEIWKAPSSGGTASQVTRDVGFGPSMSPDGRHVYYLRGAGELWRTDVESGAESRVGVSVSDWSRFAVTTHGIYFIPAREGPGGAELVIDFLDFATGRIQNVVRLDKDSFIGMTVSADERWLLLSQADQTGADLMLVENFR